jgi:hypothetical protein
MNSSQNDLSHHQEKKEKHSRPACSDGEMKAKDVWRTLSIRPYSTRGVAGKRGGRRLRIESES